jgi:hypothetical protein
MASWTAVKSYQQEVRTSVLLLVDLVHIILLQLFDTYLWSIDPTPSGCGEWLKWAYNPDASQENEQFIK